MWKQFSASGVYGQPARTGPITSATRIEGRDNARLDESIAENMTVGSECRYTIAVMSRRVLPVEIHSAGMQAALYGERLELLLVRTQTCQRFLVDARDDVHQRIDDLRNVVLDRRAQHQRDFIWG